MMKSNSIAHPDTKKLSVLHVIESLPGGPATHLNELLPIQVKHYSSVALLCLAEHSPLIKAQGVKISTIANVKRSPFGLLNYGIGIRQHIKNNKYDIVHLHSTFAGAVGRVVIPSKYADIVYCSRGWSFNMQRPAVVRRGYATVEKILSHKADWIINISQSEQESAIEFGLPTEKMSIVYNGISDAAVDLKSAETSKRQPKEPLKLLFVGRYDEQKGIDLLISAMETLKNEGVVLKTIGNHHVGKAQVMSIPSHVEDLGWQTADVIQKEMKECDLVIMPSRWEGFGFVAAEAMRAGKAVIASNVGGLSEIVIDELTGFHIKPNSVSSIISAVRKAQTADLFAMGVNARKRFIENFTSDKMFHSIDAIYSRLVDESS